MTRNIIRVIVALALIGAWVGYLHWHHEWIQDRPQVQKINCVNNLKQIGVGFRLWEGDHGDQLPFNVSTNAGGTRELCATNQDGVDSNAYLYLRTMTEEMTSPKLFVCPQDHSKRAATNLTSLRPENITYRFRCGPSVTETNGSEALVVCPIEGNTLYCDGHVEEGKRK